MSFDSRGYVLGPQDGHHVWFLDTRMTVKMGADQTGGAVTLLEWAAPVGFGPPLHLHHTEDEAFYLFEGEIAVDCGERHWTVGPGGFVFLPHGIAHSFVVVAGPVRGLQITTPGGFERFVDDLGRPAEHLGLPDPSAPDIPRLIEASHRYGHEILGPPPAVPSP
jgi:mannose-6-phosphate isomerase-like protein (cupin superfamily)